jgi:transcription elongation factor SPT5
MISVFNYDKIQKVNLKPKQWVRIKSGDYQGDLAQVLAVEDQLNKIYVRLIPRLSENATATSKKQKTSISNRPKQKLFNPTYYDRTELKQYVHPVLGEEVYNYNKMNFTFDGFLIKAVKVKSLDYEGVVPQIDELKIFDFNKYKKDDNIESLIGSIDQADIVQKKTFNKDDKVKIVKGDLMNVTGKVVSHSNGLVSMILDIEGLNNDIYELQEAYIVKLYMPGDMIKIIKGTHVGKAGLIVNIEDDTAIVYSDEINGEIKVSLHDIILSSQSTAEVQHNTYFNLGDLVKINGTNTICYVLDVQKHTLKLLDTRSQIQNVGTRDVTKLTQM